MTEQEKMISFFVLLYEEGVTETVHKRICEDFSYVLDDIAIYFDGEKYFLLYSEEFETRAI